MNPHASLGYWHTREIGENLFRREFSHECNDVRRLNRVIDVTYREYSANRSVHRLIYNGPEVRRVDLDPASTKQLVVRDPGPCENHRVAIAYAAHTSHVFNFDAGRV
nr:hypothetical protein [Cutibacterium avidum]